MAGARITRVRWWRYAVPFRAPFATAHGIVRMRTGLLLALDTEDGVTGVGECAPLPDAGAAGEALLDVAPGLLGQLVDVEVGEADLTPAPSLQGGGSIPGDGSGNGGAADRPWAAPTTAAQSRKGGPWWPIVGLEAGEVAEPWAAWPAPLRAAVDTALLDIAGQRAGRSVAALLYGDRTAARVATNATVGAAEAAVAAAQAKAAVAAGFRTIKLKVGLAAPLGEAARVAAVRAAIGDDVALRLDANEAWTVEEAIGRIAALAPFDIEYVEQPAPAADIAGLARVRQAVGVAIAADEAVTGREAAERLLAADAADVYVVKPAVVGGPLLAANLCALVARAGRRAVVTSVLECGVGVLAATHVAAGLPQPALACGLATTDLLECDLLHEPLTITGGELLLPATPGLGAAVDWDRVRRHALAQGMTG